MIVLSKLLKRFNTGSELDLLGRYSGGGRLAVERKPPLAVREYRRKFGDIANMDDVWKARDVAQETLNKQRLSNYSPA